MVRGGRGFFSFPALVLTCLLLCSSSHKARGYRVLQELSPPPALAYLNFSFPTADTRAACSQHVLTLALGSEGRAWAGEGMAIEFAIVHLLMGPSAGRVLLLLDDVDIGECPAQVCRLSIEQAALSAGKHELLLSFVAPEPTLTTQAAVALGTTVHVEFELQGGGELPLENAEWLRAGEEIDALACKGLEHRKEAEEEDGHGEDGQGRLEEPERFAAEGESNEVQTAFMRNLVASHRHIRRVLEIGFHAGRASRAFLSGRGDVEVVSCDIGRHGHEENFWKFTVKKFPRRHSLILGDSAMAVPAFARMNQLQTFDLFFVDGGHSLEQAHTDMINCHALASARRTGEEGKGTEEEEEERSLVMMDDLTPWVYWGRGPTAAWERAIEEGMIEEVEFYRQKTRAELLCLPDQGGVEQGGMQEEQSCKNASGWTRMNAEEFEELKRKYGELRSSFDGSDEAFDTIKVWAVGKFTSGRGRGRAREPFVVELKQEDLPGGSEQKEEAQELEAGVGTQDGRSWREAGGVDGVAVCVIGKEEEIDALLVSMSTVISMLPGWPLQIFYVPKFSEELKSRVKPMLELLDMLDQVTYLELPEHVQERFVRSGTTKELWNTHHDHPEGGMRLLWERGIHYDTLLKTKWFWEQVRGEEVLIFQADSLLCRDAELDVTAFLDYDYVGAPWRQGQCPPHNDQSLSICMNDFIQMVDEAGFFLENYSLPDGQGGNGGLSFRKRSKMLEIVERCKFFPSMEWNEDVFFSFPCPGVNIRLPPLELAAKFSVESGQLVERPFGLHKPWRHRTGSDLKILTQACPELPVLAGLCQVNIPA